MVERRDVELGVDGGDRGWLFLPSKRAGPLPAISVAHGYAEEISWARALRPRSWFRQHLSRAVMNGDSKLGGNTPWPERRGSWNPLVGHKDQHAN